MKQKFFIILAGLLILSSPVFAGNVWINNTTVNGIQALNDGRFIIYLPAASDPVCLESGKLFYVVSGQNGINSDGAKTILSLALVAYSTGNKISIAYDNSNSNCYVQQLYLNNSK